MPEERVEYETGGNPTDTPPPPDTGHVSDPHPQAAIKTGEPMDMAEAIAAIQRVADKVEALTGQVETLSTTVADQESTRTVIGMGEAPRDLAVRGMRTGVDQIEIALEALDRACGFRVDSGKFRERRLDLWLYVRHQIPSTIAPVADCAAICVPVAAPRIPLIASRVP